MLRVDTPLSPRSTAERNDGDMPMRRAASATRFSIFIPGVEQRPDPEALLAAICIRGCKRVARFGGSSTSGIDHVPKS
jgi:hypothetical protein